LLEEHHAPYTVKVLIDGLDNLNTGSLVYDVIQKRRLFENRCFHMCKS